MTWKQATFVVNANQVEPLSTILETFMASAVTTENAGEDEFFEVAFPGKPDWETVQVTGLFDDKIDLDPIIDFIQDHFSEKVQTEIPVSVNKLVDQDWERVWLSSFKPIEVGSNLWVCPSWCKPTEPSARNIILDPGLAFGTGTHATTHMCLQWLSEQNLDNQKVLDYGSGSGILAIAALLSNASYADAVDIDPLAVQACSENAKRNNVSELMAAYLPNDLPQTDSQYDLVIANILADVIIELKDTLLANLKTNGTLLMTGILSTQADKVKNAFGNNFSFNQTDKGQWCLLTAKFKD